MNWGLDQVLAAVRTTLSEAHLHTWAFEWADVEGEQLLVVFRMRADRFGVHYSLADLPNGPNTGTPCDTPEQWAAEVGWDVDEHLDTFRFARAERISGPGDVVLLRWRG